MSEQLTVREACEVLGIGRTSLYKLIASKQIVPTKPRGLRKTLFQRRELERYLDRSSRARA